MHKGKRKKNDFYKSNVKTKEQKTKQFGRRKNMGKKHERKSKKIKT